MEVCNVDSPIDVYNFRVVILRRAGPPTDGYCKMSEIMGQKWSVNIQKILSCLLPMLEIVFRSQLTNSPQSKTSVTIEPLRCWTYDKEYKYLRRIDVEILWMLSTYLSQKHFWPMRVPMAPHADKVSPKRWSSTDISFNPEDIRVSRLCYFPFATFNSLFLNFSSASIHNPCVDSNYPACQSTNWTFLLHLFRVSVISPLSHLHLTSSTLRFNSTNLLDFRLFPWYRVPFCRVELMV